MGDRGGRSDRFGINFNQTNLGGRFAISFAGMKKPVKKDDRKTQASKIGQEEAPYVSEYAHILEAELEVNPDFGKDQKLPPDIASTELSIPVGEKSEDDGPEGERSESAGRSNKDIESTGRNDSSADLQIVFEGVQDMAHQIEALLFASEKPLDVRQVATLISSLLPEAVKVTQVQRVLDELMDSWRQRPGGFELVQSGGGYCFLTRSAFLPIVQKAVLEQTKRKLSVASLETLSIVAYKQPVSKPEVEQIRGVNCDFSIQKLLEKNLIKISGKGDGPGRPTLYATTDLFMDYFGINHIKQLPQLKDIEQEGHEIGRDDEDERILTELLHQDPDIEVNSEHIFPEVTNTSPQGNSIQDDNTENENTLDSSDAAESLS